MSNNNSPWVAGDGWEIPGQTVTSYTQTLNAGVKTNDLTECDRSELTVKFYWIAPGTNNVTYTMIVGGVKTTVTATFVVQIPTGWFKGQASTIGVNFGPSGKDTGSNVPTLNFGTAADPGMSFGGSVTTTDTEAGRVEALQVLTYLDMNYNDGLPLVNTGSSFVLDDTKHIFENGAVKYVIPLNDQVFTVRACDSTSVYWHDSPGWQPNDGWHTINDTDLFATTLMYRPDGLKSIYVSLQTVIWGFSATAKEESGRWRIVSSHVDPPKIYYNSDLPRME